MTKKAKARRDAFTFSLQGMTTIASFAVAPVIADDRINKVLDERLKRNQEEEPAAAEVTGVSWGRFWLRRHRKPAQC